MWWRSKLIRPNVRLADHTSFRIGGPAEWFAEPSTMEELADILRQASRSGWPVAILGGGTNTLAADRGVRGLVIHLGRAFRTLEAVHADDSTVTVRCGAALSTHRLVSRAAAEGWADLEVLAGLPGQLGGAVTMNAQNIGQFVREVHVVGHDGSLQVAKHADLEFAYRFSRLPFGVIAAVVLQFNRIAPDESSRRIQAVLARRNATQDLTLPSAGCAFRNPPGAAAGRLIDELGLKGTREGDAQVSNRHANFIVNTGRARCDDVLALMDRVQAQVRRSFGCLLEPEVRLLGEAWTSIR